MVLVEHFNNFIFVRLLFCSAVCTNIAHFEGSYFYCQCLLSCSALWTPLSHCTYSTEPSALPTFFSHCSTPSRRYIHNLITFVCDTYFFSSVCTVSFWPQQEQYPWNRAKPRGSRKSNDGKTMRELWNLLASVNQLITCIIRSWMFWSNNLSICLQINQTFIKGCVLLSHYQS